MLLMTKELEKRFEKYPLYSQEEKGITSPFGLKIEREQYVTGGKVKNYI